MRCDTQQRLGWLLSLLLLASSSRAQTILDDTQGRSSLLLPASYVGLNTADETLKAGFFHDPYSIRTRGRTESTRLSEPLVKDTLLSRKRRPSLDKPIQDNAPLKQVKELKRWPRSGCTTAYEILVVVTTYTRLTDADTTRRYRERTVSTRYCVDSLQYDVFPAFYVGAQVQAKNVGGISTLFSEGNFSLDSKVNLLVGKHSVLFREVEPGANCTLYAKRPNNKGHLWRDWMTLRLGYQAAKYYTYDNSRAWRDQLPEHKFRGLSGGVYYNVNLDGNWLFGVAGGYQRINNYAALDEVTVQQRYVGTNASKDSSRIVDKKVSAGLGNFHPYNSAFFYADVARFLYPKVYNTTSMLALNLYLRADRYLNDRFVRRMGLGAYLLNPKSGAINLGLFVEQTDWTNATGQDSTFGERIKVGATLKFPVGAVFVAPTEKAAKAAN